MASSDNRRPYHHLSLALTGPSLQKMLRCHAPATDRAGIPRAFLPQTSRFQDIGVPGSGFTLLSPQMSSPQSCGHPLETDDRPSSVLQCGMFRFPWLVRVTCLRRRAGIKFRVQGWCLTCLCCLAGRGSASLRNPCRGRGACRRRA